MDEILKETATSKYRMLDDLLFFTKVFFKLRTGRKFETPQPVGRESHYTIIAKALYRVYKGECTKLIINVPPRYGKTEMLINFVAWTLAQNPESNFLYISVSHDLATRATSLIRNIITTPSYSKMFEVKLRGDSSAKDSFTTTAGGTIEAIGSGGTIVGKGAGLRGYNGFGGAIIIDDVHKPDEATSDVIRESVIGWFYNTLLSRRNNGDKTPIIYIGQRVHEQDLAAHLIEQNAGWETIILPALDGADNPLCPELHSKYELKQMRDQQQYVFASQFQQNPQPAGGGLFKTNDFLILDDEPKILSTFITVDTAETEKHYNDATVFSLWGLYEINSFGLDTKLYAIHWLHCVEIFVEPKDLQKEFLEFYAMSHRKGMIPSFCAIEKKSTGTTLISVLKDVQGLVVVQTERTIKSGSKTDRFISMQSIVAQKRVTLPYGAKHTKMCIEHMAKITANNTHRRDDIADTCYDAVKIALIDKTVHQLTKSNDKVYGESAKHIINQQTYINTQRSNIWT